MAATKLSYSLQQTLRSITDLKNVSLEDLEANKERECFYEKNDMKTKMSWKRRDEIDNPTNACIQEINDVRNCLNDLELERLSLQREFQKLFRVNVSVMKEMETFEHTVRSPQTKQKPVLNRPTKPKVSLHTIVNLKIGLKKLRHRAAEHAVARKPDYSGFPELKRDRKY